MLPTPESLEDNSGFCETFSFDARSEKSIAWRDLFFFSVATGEASQKVDRVASEVHTGCFVFRSIDNEAKMTLRACALQCRDFTGREKEKGTCVIIASVASGKPVVIHFQLYLLAICNPHSWPKKAL